MTLITEQEVLDRMVRGVIDQGGPAWDEMMGTCVYRLEIVQPDSDEVLVRRCGIGQFISDADYHPDFEGLPIANADAYSIRAAAGLDHLDSDFLIAIQDTHDTAACFTGGTASVCFWQKLRDGVTYWAEIYELIPPNVRYPDEEQVD